MVCTLWIGGRSSCQSAPGSTQSAAWRYSWTSIVSKHCRSASKTQTSIEHGRSHAVLAVPVLPIVLRQFVFVSHNTIPLKSCWIAVQIAGPLLVMRSRHCVHLSLVLGALHMLLRGFNYVYKQLVLDSPLTSKFCFAEPAFYKLATYETIRNEIRRTCVFRDFWRSYSSRTIKHHQNHGKVKTVRHMNGSDRNGSCSSVC